MGQSFVLGNPTPIPQQKIGNKQRHQVRLYFGGVSLLPAFMISYATVCYDNATADFVSDDIEIAERTELVQCLTTDYVKHQYLRRLEKLKVSLHRGWNGEDDLPIEEKSYQNAKAALSATPAEMLQRWNLFPVSNGTLQLSPIERDIAGISIGNDRFSYAAYVSDEKQLEGEMPFSVENFSNVLRKIHAILGYA